MFLLYIFQFQMWLYSINVHIERLVALNNSNLSLSFFLTFLVRSFVFMLIIWSYSPFFHLSFDLSRSLDNSLNILSYILWKSQLHVPNNLPYNPLSPPPPPPPPLPLPLPLPISFKFNANRHSNWPPFNQSKKQNKKYWYISINIHTNKAFGASTPYFETAAQSCALQHQAAAAFLSQTFGHLGQQQQPLSSVLQQQQQAQSNHHHHHATLHQNHHTNSQSQVNSSQSSGISTPHLTHTNSSPTSGVHLNSQTDSQGSPPHANGLSSANAVAAGFLDLTPNAAAAAAAQFATSPGFVSWVVWPFLWWSTSVESYIYTYTHTQTPTQQITLALPVNVDVPIPNPENLSSHPNGINM